MPSDARIGTSSVRRRSLVAEARPDVEVVELRGNLDTRLRKVAEGEIDAAILALAGIERLDEQLVADAARLDPSRWIPAPGQGALAVEARADRGDLVELFGGLSDSPAEAELASERAFAPALEEGCSVPLGCLASVRGDRMVVSGFLGDPNGGESFRDRISGPLGDAARLGDELAGAILDAGGRK